MNDINIAEEEKRHIAARAVNQSAGDVRQSSAMPQQDYPNSFDAKDLAGYYGHFGSSSRFS